MRKQTIRAHVCGSMIVSCVAASTALAHPKPAVIHADSVAEIVSAVEAANQSGTRTVIKVASGRYEFAEAVDTGLGLGVLPAVTGNVSIVGTDADSTVLDAQGRGRIATVAEGGRLALKHLTLTRGVSICDGDVCLQPGTGGGAAINFGEALTLEDCVVTNNTTHSAEGFSSNTGGAIANWSGRLRVEDTLITSNGAQGVGGGIALLHGRAVIASSIIRDNRLSLGFGSGGVVRGAGLFIGDADVLVWGSTISGNRFESQDPDWIGIGGGIDNSRGVLLISKSAVIENSIVHGGQGAGINNGGVMHIRDSTIGANSVEGPGGGIYNAGSLRLAGVTIASNEGGEGLRNETSANVRLVRTLIGANRLGPGIPGPDCQGVLSSLGRNALSNSSACTLQPVEGARDLLDIDPRIGDLVENGEAGEAHFPLLADSPLIDAGGKVHDHCSPRDQLGQPRRDGNGDGKVRCDIGAIEFQPKK
jgi:hypothetical protein